MLASVDSMFDWKRKLLLVMVKYYCTNTYNLLSGLQAEIEQEIISVFQRSSGVDDDWESFSYSFR